jgi:hypothetical protein
MPCDGFQEADHGKGPNVVDSKAEEWDDRSRECLGGPWATTWGHCLSLVHAQMCTEAVEGVQADV